MACRCPCSCSVSTPAVAEFRVAFSRQSQRNKPYHCNNFLPFYHRSDKAFIRRTWANAIQCTLTISKESASYASSSLDKEPHKYFDHVVITVRSGDGGHGALLSMPKPRIRDKTRGKRNSEKEKRSSFKRDSDGSVILPMGGHGGDVIIYADASVDSLLEFHKIQRFKAKRGGNVDSMGYFIPPLLDGHPAPTLRIPVPVGTVVKRKRGSKLLADLANSGDQILVARGGRGGISLVEMPQKKLKLLKDLNTNVVKSESDKELIFGQSGEEIKIELILRVVADVGLVGLPNAGKSSLLAAVTSAKPDIADYPFTTLMPNLGCISGDPNLGVWGYSSSATLADLPGLIRGAHLGKGLGRNFLRHLRRTRLLVHVVDISAEEPVQDYLTLREELGMYNPEYIRRPHLVVLNKLDIPEARQKFNGISQEIIKGNSSRKGRGSHLLQEQDNAFQGNMNGASQDASAFSSVVCDKEGEDYSCPLAVIGISALKCVGIEEMLKEIRLILKNCEASNGNSLNGSWEPIVCKPLEYDVRTVDDNTSL